ncbi:hypothetical protein ACO0QE_001402 [Hanseniaspora vineae]
MPSKNSINRPKDTTHQARKLRQLSKKRQQREQKGLFAPSRSSDSSKSGQAYSESYDLYKGEYSRDAGNAVTNKTLSKKRAQKIERNLRYAEQRKLMIDLEKNAEESGMAVDSVNSSSSSALAKQNKKKESELERIRSSMWEAIEEQKSTGLLLQNGTGTTLGGQYFP